MNINELFPSRFIKADELEGKQYTLTIRNVTLEKMGKEQEENPVVWFQEAKKGMVLKKTNAQIIANLYGPETDSWAGKRITITSQYTKGFGGVNMLVVLNKVPPPPQAPQAEAPKPAARPGLSEAQRAHLAQIAALSNRHDSFFDEVTDLTQLRELLREGDGIDQDEMPTTPAPGKKVSMYHYLCQLIEDGVGVDDCAEPILTYLLGRVVSADTPPTISAKGILLDDLMSDDPGWSDAILAAYAHIKENLVPA